MGKEVVTKITLANHIIYPGCENPKNLNETDFFDSAANVSLLFERAPSNKLNPQFTTKTILQLYGAQMFTTKTLELLLYNLPKAAREVHQSPGLINNLLLVSVPCDACCDI